LSPLPPGRPNCVAHVAKARATRAIEQAAAARTASAIRKNQRAIRGPLSLGRPSAGGTTRSHAAARPTSRSLCARSAHSGGAKSVRSRAARWHEGAGASEGVVSALGRPSASGPRIARRFFRMAAAVRAVARILMARVARAMCTSETKLGRPGGSGDNALARTRTRRQEERGAKRRSERSESQLAEQGTGARFDASGSRLNCRVRTKWRVRYFGSSTNVWTTRY